MVRIIERIVLIKRALAITSHPELADDLQKGFLPDMMRLAHSTGITLL